MNKRYFAIACFSMAVAVTLGALAAHTLKGALSPEQLMSFQTGVRYHVYHSIALLVFAIHFSSRPWNTVMLLMSVGTLMFSGSIYLLSTRGLHVGPERLSFLGPITPLGGLMLIAAWCLAGIQGIKRVK